MYNFFPYKKPIDVYHSELDGIRRRIEAGELTVDATGEENALSVAVEKLGELLRKYPGKELEVELRKTIHTYEKQLIERHKVGLPESAYIWTITDTLRNKYFERFPENRV